MWCAAGWRAVAAAFVTMAHSPGVHYCYGIFQAELVATRALGTSSRALVGAAGSLSTALMELGAYMSGVLQERLGARDTVRLGGVLATLGLALAAASTQVWHMYLSFGVCVGLAHSLTFPPCPVAVAHFFDGLPRAGLASGVATAGSGFGAAVGAVAVRAIIAARNWRVAFLFLAASSALWIIGAAPALGTARTTRLTFTLESPLLGPLRRQAQAAAVYGLGWEVPFVHAVSYSRDRGYSRSAAAALVIFVGLGGALGRVAFLAAADRVGPAETCCVACAATALADGVLPVIINHPAGLYAYGFVVGSTAGACIGVTTPLAKACLAAADDAIPLAKASGLVYSAMSPGLLLGPIIAGVIRDMTHSFDAAFFFAAACWLGALALCVSLRRGLRRSQQPVLNKAEEEEEEEDTL